MRSGQPFPVCILLAVALAASACGGSTAVTSVVGPGAARCQTTVAAQPTSVAADGGAVTVTVTAARDCTWTATSDASWMSLSATSGQGDGSLTATVARNEQPTARAGAIVVNDQRATVSQEARPCTFELNGSTLTMSSAGGRGSIQVTTLSGCAWNATASAGWIRVNTPSGTGPGTLEYEVLPNEGAAREASITVGDRQVTIRQQGAGDPTMPPSCAPAVNPRTIDLPLDGGTATIQLTINNTCNWTAAGGLSDTWLIVTPATGRGNGTITVRADRNDGAARTATVTIAQQVVTVTQPGSCAVSINPGSGSYPQAGGTGVISVQAGMGCAWSASSDKDWAALTQASGNGTGEARYTVRPNNSTSSRTATITIGSRQHTVNQRGCSFTLSPSTATIPGGGGRGSVRVNTEGSCPWTVSGAITGMSVDPASGTGSGDVSYTVPANGVTTARTITLRIGGQSHVITQEAGAPPPAPTCTFQLDSGSRSFPDAGGSATVRVTGTPTGCAGTWSVVGAPEWVQVSGGSGSGSGEFSYTVARNTGTEQRTATLTVGGQTHQITQAGMPPPTPTCTFQLDSGSRSFPDLGGSLTVRVTATPPGCAGTWSVVGAPEWVQVSGGSGSGSGEFSYTVARNTGTEQRTATLTVGGQTHQITQAGTPPPTPTCTFQLDSGSRSFPDLGGSLTVRVTATPPGCAGTWSVAGAPEWVQVSGGSGSGSGEFSYTVARNTGTEQRTATLTVGGQTHQITQAGMPPPTPTCTLSVSPSSSPQIPWTGGGSQFTINTEQTCQWSFSGGGGWATPSGPTTGAGQAPIVYTAAQNPTTSARSATFIVTVGGLTASHTVHQDPAPPPCTYSIEPRDREVPASGGEFTVRVTTGNTCQWSASSTVDWIRVTTPSGTGTFDVRYQVEPNRSDDDREGTVTINGQVHRVKQEDPDDNEG